MNKEIIENISVNDKRYKENKKAYTYAWDMTIKELKQACEGFFHNLNTLQSRSGNQLPFSSINYGTCTLPEGKAVTEKLIDATIEGTGKHHRTSIFPCVIFQYDKDIHGTKENPGPNYDLFRKALTANVKRDYPNWANTNWSAQKSWVEKDYIEKHNYIDSLSDEDYAKLLDWVEKNPIEAEKLNLKISDK